MTTSPLALSRNFPTVECPPFAQIAVLNAFAVDAIRAGGNLCLTCLASGRDSHRHEGRNGVLVVSALASHDC